MDKVFVDTDIILDLLSARSPFYEFAANLFSLADKGSIKISVSALSFANLNYILNKHLTPDQTRKKLQRFKTLVTVLPVNDKVVDLALASDFKDFEDGIQYFTAIENNIKILVTRNLKDFKSAEIPVLSAESYLKSK